MNLHNSPLYAPCAEPAMQSFAYKPFQLKQRCRFTDFTDKALAAELHFHRITPADMPAIWPIISQEAGRTTDFSYGGLLMWVDYFHYEFAILNDTLFIKGRVESDVSKVAFSLPIGKMPLEKCVAILKEYCCLNNLQLIFSAVPEYALEEFDALRPSRVEELTDWADYIYDAEPLATLRGKKMSKKRNHVNQFMAAYPGYRYERLTAHNVPDALRFMDLIDAEGDHTPMAETERRLNREMLRYMAEGDPVLHGGMLRDADGTVLAYTIGDVKGDTLFIHIEKSLRSVPGGFEMINKCFAEEMCSRNPGIRYINREDDAGDPGLRAAKESYHPLPLLRKYNISM
ncbi:MAG: phosphatidylglycerol lysyltransferase domain-containing protein [Muribaculaceae bacterium]|nr:phosphatidylglycerol lysyltransferase domain-containing protein [Muribaculaceae bacterium]